ncbi:DUF6314 family protein [Arthrobacter sp. CAN_A1]|uniref:DUF6314 family protein n=1 Tax=Arthrobacter sp. CAN_A1 TaxID=2787717 RepID=UPI0018C9822A
MTSFAQYRLTATGTLLGYLDGSWSVDRTLQDLSSGLSGTFSGIATFAPDDDGALLHSERGTLVWAGYSPAPATRELLWRAAGSAPSAEVFFPDGRYFHGLDLTTGEDSPVHQCAPDVYRGHFVLVDAESWRYTWRVSGPAKDLVLETRLRRMNETKSWGSGPPA